jgi:hypothetical protein
MLSNDCRRDLIGQAEVLLGTLSHGRILRILSEQLTQAVTRLDNNKDARLQIIADGNYQSLTLHDHDDCYGGRQERELIGVSGVGDKEAITQLALLNKQIIAEVRIFVEQRMREHLQQHLAAHDKLLCEALHVPYNDTREHRGVKIREKEADVTSE